jgi:hypothetical protein
VSRLDPDQLSPARLAGAVLEALAAGPGTCALPPPDLDGLGRAVQELHAAVDAARVPLTPADRRGALAHVAAG